MFKVAYSPIYSHKLPPGHRFPMEKYDLLPKQLLHEGTLENENFFEPKQVDLEHVYKIHSKEYVTRYLNLELTKREERRTGFKHTSKLVDRERTLIQGTIDCSHFAIKHGVSMNIAGGTHHACPNHGEGFCMLNDQAIAAQYLLDNKLANKILIIDLDVHQGNGTAEIFENTPNVYTFSMHGASNYPMVKAKSDLDIPLENNTSDDFYLSTLAKTLIELKEKVNPDFLFYQSGVDVLETDKLGKLSLTIEGCRTRDEIVLNFAKENNIPLVACMGGGYSEDIKIIIDAHANTFRLAQEIYF